MRKYFIWREISNLFPPSPAPIRFVADRNPAEHNVRERAPQRGREAPSRKEGRTRSRGSRIWNPFSEEEDDKKGRSGFKADGWMDVGLSPILPTTMLVDWAGASPHFLSQVGGANRWGHGIYWCHLLDAQPRSRK